MVALMLAAFGEHVNIRRKKYFRTTLRSALPPSSCPLFPAWGFNGTPFPGWVVWGSDSIPFLTEMKWS